MHVVRFPGATYVEAGDHRILFGTFPEIHQHLMKQGLGWPDAVVFSDAILRDRLAQMVPEFLFFGHVFFNQNFDWAHKCVKKPLIFLGTEHQVERATRIMDVSYLGLTDEVLARDLDPTRVAFLKAECDYFALKNAQGEIIPTRDYLDCRTWDDQGVAMLDDVRIVRTGMLRYTVSYADETVAIDLSAPSLQGPAWIIPEVSELRTSRQYSVRILGAAGAFQHVSPSTSYLLTLNGEHYLIDCSPYVHRTLEQFGIAIDQIKGLFISHVHDDHTGDLAAFATSGHRTDLYTSREVWEALKIKLACILDTNEAAIEASFRFREVRPETPLTLGGGTLQFHDACHAVPCVGMTLRVEDDELVITSDTSGHRQLLDMLDKGVLTEERFQALEGLLDGQTVVVDCGEAVIHGYIQDFMHRDDTSNLVLAHRHTLPPEFESAFTLARPLQLFELGPKDEVVLDTVSIARTLDGWNLADRWNWVGLFALHQQIKEPMVGEVILHQGSAAANDYFYVITHGFFDVLVNGTKVAQLRAGDFFGEQAFITPEGTRLASVVATTPSRLLAIPGEHFSAMLAQEDQKATRRATETITERLRRLWENREVISRVRIFAGLDTQTLNAFSMRLERVQIDPQQVVVAEGARDDSACYLVMCGSLQVEQQDQDDRPILRENDLFGEGVAAGFVCSRTATVRAIEPCTLLKLRHQDLQAIGSEHPHVLFALRDLVAQRQYLAESAS